MDLKSKIILISGPTASGKSKAALKIAKKLNGEIINADSMQVYKELNILTARPSKTDLNKIDHHLYGFRSVKKEFSSGEWLKLAKKNIKKIRDKNKIPVLVGGTGLYFKALTDGLVKIPKIPIYVRDKIRRIQNKLGQKKFYLKLLKIDPSVKNRIDPTDTQRSIRAYEVKKFTKKSLHEWFKNTKSNYLEEDFFKIYIDYPRDELVERIHQRTGKMIKMGAVNEVKRFLKLKIKKQMTACKAIGVNEIQEYLSKEKKIDEIKEKISIKTRQYAKRQSTWARGNMSDWVKLKPSEINNFLKKI